MSIQFYNDNAQAFFESTLSVDLSPITQRFIATLPANGHILDAGCGSGRDSRTFLNLGYRVTAFDASAALAELASQHIGQPVAVATFETFESNEKFDGIWACASLLHVPANDLPGVFQKSSTLLKPSGRFYCSFKYGNEDVEIDGRRFTQCDETRMTGFLQGSRLTVETLWQSADARPGREGEQWLNVILSLNTMT